MTHSQPKCLKNKNQKGSALIYILIAIALLGALTVSFMEPSSQQTSSQNSFRTVASLQGQVDTIRSALQECVLIYPNGDATINSGSTTDPGYNRPYPINPDSSHLPTAGSYRAANKNLENVRCPGNNDGSADQHKRVFAGGSGKFLPPPPDLFSDWQYFNGDDGIFVWTSTDKTDAFLISALEKVDEKFSECEADIIVSGSSATNLDSAPTSGVTCPANSTCFRVWFIDNGSGPHADNASGCGGSSI